MGRFERRGRDGRYATAAWGGALVLIGLLALGTDAGLAALAAGVGILLIRMAAIRWGIELPRYTAKGSEGHHASDLD